VFNTTFNNISVISCRSVLLVEETRLHTENHQPAASRGGSRGGDTRHAPPLFSHEIPQSFSCLPLLGAFFLSVPPYLEILDPPPASYWQTLSHDVVSSTPHHEWDSNLQHYWSWAQIAQIVVNPTTIWSRPSLPPKRRVKGIVLLLWELKFSNKVHYKADFF
jgi:hypothetical protein